MTPPLPPPQKPKNYRGLAIGLGVVIVVLVSAVVAYAFSRKDDTSSVTAGTAASASTVAGGVAPGETQAVKVTGDPLVAPPGPGEQDAAIGVTPPVLAGYTFDGSPITITPGGTAKMVVFLAHWCPHCNREIPRILQWAADGKVPEGMEIIGVTTGVDSTLPNYPPSKWIVDKGWTYPVLADSADRTAANAYGLTGFPYFVVIGKDGTVKVRFSGEIEEDQLDALVRSALAG
jgi:thiol-disulfide isomerase/thioredoxin